MDNDTIFPALSESEMIMGKYRGADRSQMKRAIAILTNFRLLIRWKGMTCGCFTHSSYSSIMIDSIDRIDDARLQETAGIFVMIFLLLGGIGLIIGGFVYKATQLFSMGIGGIIIGVLILIVFCCGNKYKYITFKGPFGSETIVFEKSTANEFEIRLSKMVHQRRMHRFIEQNGPRSLLEPSAQMASNYNIDMEIK
ncbi:unnamed protein product [Adineta ricciae]|uniref:Uncharacterized protein n=1 Tax=Adineta ricciae TaxID=249248 RepID=A0A813UF07_ADIRI|nr:unnamed protein product [Adineta ricciae]CAF1438222.1 unnamed protein product [Adineta ricciae]